MPLFPSCSRIRRRSEASLSVFLSTSKYRFGRLKPVTIRYASRSSSIDSMSLRTCAVAVAVKAATAGRRGREAMNGAMRR